MAKHGKMGIVSNEEFLRRYPNRQPERLIYIRKHYELYVSKD